MHNEMARILADVVARIAHHYTDVISWVAPGLTHRSFVIGNDERSFHHVATSRLVGDKRLELIGANDHLPSERRIACLPLPNDCQRAIERLSHRLKVDIPKATAIYARGGNNATPLALPELLDVLVRRLTGERAKTMEKHAHDRVATDHRG